MKKLILIFILAAVGFNCEAKEPKIDEIIKDMSPVVTSLEDSVKRLEADLTAAKELYNKIKDRKYVLPSALPDENSVETYLDSFDSLKEMFAKGNQVRDKLYESSESKLCAAYGYILHMIGTLSRPYEEPMNNQYIEFGPKLAEFVRPKHKEEFDRLLNHINDYNYYMFELARMFVAADSDGYNKDIETLVKDEDAPYLLEVPYTSEMLEMYIREKGKLPQDAKAELYKSCPDAFPDFAQ